MNSNVSKGQKILNIIVLVFKVIVFCTYGLALTGAAVWQLVKTAQLIYGLVAAGVYPVGMLMSNICLAMSLVCFAAYAWRFVFNKKLAWLSYSKLSRFLVIFLVGAAMFDGIDQLQTDDFTYAAYPGYITEWDTDVLYSTQDCDYSDTLYFEGYMDFMGSGFRQQANVYIEYDRSLTDAYRIELHYKGLPAEMYINSDGNIHNISVWTTDYDYELTADDYVYMYKNRENLEYSNPLAVEKIIIRTAYPEKIDVSGIAD
ncbi:MAG: hypothetical protein IJ410_00375 [Oscillospiraceae bacterium]|nr:hypothetical protein [Oscillospiraceae bacterium]